MMHLRPNSRLARRLAGLVGISALIALSGLSCSRMPLTAPSGSTIALYADTNVLPVNGSTSITAYVIEGGSTTGTGGNTTVTPGAGVPVHNGTVVTFSTTLGQISPGTADTNAGKAVATLTGDGRSGTATITAISGPASKTMTVAIGAAGASRIAVTANPQSLPATGGSCTITASVQDAQGNGLLGVPVSFSTTAGTLSATTVVSDASGNASTTLTTNAAATVTASSGGATAALTGTVAVTLNSKILLTVTNTSAITVSVPTTFTIAVSSSGGTSAPALVNNLVIDFGDGSRPFSFGQVNGSVTAGHLYGQSGALTVTVTATDPQGNTTQVSSPIVIAPLTAVAVANPTTVALGNPILFTVTPTTGALIDHYIWDFGDGTTITTASNAQSHVYLTQGGHTATVTVVPTAGPPLSLPVPIVIQ